MHPLYTILKNKPVKLGANATVWIARDEVLKREVALKELRGWASRPARALACFQFAHFRRLQLSHPGLAPVHGAVCDRGWIVLDHHPHSLADHAEPIQSSTVRRILGEVASTLHYLHSQGYVHGSVRPANLFGTLNSKVVLADGIGIHYTDRSDENGTKALLPLDARDGKYLAPESLSGNVKNVTPAVDLYSLGLVGLELLLGHQAFNALFPMVQAGVLRWDEWHGSEEVLPSVRQIISDIPEDLADLISRLIHKTPSQRPNLEYALKILSLGNSSKSNKSSVVTVSPVAPVDDSQLLVSTAKQLACVVPADSEGSNSNRGWIYAAVAAGLGGMSLGLAASILLPRATNDATNKDSQPVTITQSASPENHSLVNVISSGLPSDTRERDSIAQSAHKALVQIAQYRSQFNQLSAQLSSAEDRAGNEKSRADMAAAELKRYQMDHEKIQLDITKRDQSISLLSKQLKSLELELAQSQQTTANRDRSILEMGRLLKSAQDDQSRLRAEIERSKSAVPGALELLPAPDNRTTNAIIANLKKIGGKIEVDMAKPDQPVLAVDLTGTKITDDHLALLSGLTTLRSLMLVSTTVGDSGLAHVAKLTNLETLNLHGTLITDNGMAQLKGLAKLRTLQISSTRVGDVGLANIRGLKSLESLYISNTTITNAGMTHLKEMTSLRVLHLSNTNISDAGADHIKGLTKLRELQLAYTSIGAQGVRDLQKLLPDCQIEFGPPRSLPGGS